MIQSFLGGYNVTIIAYGQTGSGKTFTMGSDSQDDCTNDNDMRGFIPRFMEEVFARINTPPPPGASSGNGPVDESTAVPVHDTSGSENGVSLGNVVDAPSTTVSFLEIYGEEIYDLLQEPELHIPGTVGGRDMHHHQSKSLALREESGSVSVVGLTEVTIADSAEAMEQLSRGTQHRTTASTLMNTVSSRSHAVFALTLHQKLFGEAYSPEGQEVVSKLSFVDLAGSERLKRTGAEGQRMKEGIQINKGLLALGNVINALADEEHQKAGHEKHVGYRESKLTRLLQDALGGNSQTLFLACVSPAEVNLSETLSTLRYANRARNIQNKPVKNTDPMQEELRRLHAYTKVLRIECVKERFGIQGLEGENSSDCDQVGHCGAVTAEEAPLDEEKLGQLLERQDVKDYLEDLHCRLKESAASQIDTGSIFSKPLIVASASYFAVPHGVNAPTLITANNTLKSRRQSIVNLRRQSFAHGLNAQPLTPGSLLSPVAQQSVGKKTGLSNASCDEVGGSAVHETSIIEESLAALGTGDEEALDPENDMRMINKLLEMVKKDEEFEKKEKEHQMSIGNMDHQIEEQEQILGQLKKNISQYQVLLDENDLLMRELHSLEGEKAQLVLQLTQHEKENAKTGGGSAAYVNKLKEKLKGVEASLRTQRVEQKKREDAMNLIKRDSGRCRELENNIKELKRAKVDMLRKQKDVSARFKGFMDQKNRELNETRKCRRREKLQASKLQNENRKLQTAYSRKVKAHQKTEEALRRNKAHLMKLLAMRKRERQRKSTCQRVCRSRSSLLANPGTRTVIMGQQETPSKVCETSPSKMWALEDQALQSAKFCLMQMVNNRVQKQQQKEHEQQLQGEYDLLQKQVYEEVGHLNALKDAFDGEADTEDAGPRENALVEGRAFELIEHEERLEELIVKLDLVGCALSELHIPAYSNTESLEGADNSSTKDAEDDEKEALEMDMLSQLDAAALRTLIWSILDDHSEQEFQHRLLSETLRRKEAELKASDLRCEKLEKHNKELRRGFHERMSILHSERIEFAQAVCSPSGKNRRLGKSDKLAKSNLRSPVGISQSEESIAQLKELEALRAMNADLESKYDEAQATTKMLRTNVTALQTENMAVSERLSLATATLEQQSDSGQAEILSQLEAIQSVWANVGTPAETRKLLVSRIESAPKVTAQTILDETQSSYQAILTDVESVQKELYLLKVVAGLTPSIEGTDGVEENFGMKSGETSGDFLLRLRNARDSIQVGVLQETILALQKKAANFTGKIQCYKAFKDAVPPTSPLLSFLLAMDVINLFTVEGMQRVLESQGTAAEEVAKAKAFPPLPVGETERLPGDIQLHQETGNEEGIEREGATLPFVEILETKSKLESNNIHHISSQPAILIRCIESWSSDVRDLAVCLARLQARHQDLVTVARSQLIDMGIHNVTSFELHLWPQKGKLDCPIDRNSETFMAICRHILLPDTQLTAEARAHETDLQFLTCLVGVATAISLSHTAHSRVSSSARNLLERYFKSEFERFKGDVTDITDCLSLPRIGTVIATIDECLSNFRENVTAARLRLHKAWESEQIPQDARIALPEGYKQPLNTKRMNTLNLSDISSALLAGEPIAHQQLIGLTDESGSVLKLLECAHEEAKCMEEQMVTITQGERKVEDKISERVTIVKLDKELNRLYAESSEFEEKNKDPSRLQDRTGKGRKALLHEESQRQLFQKSIRKTLVELQRALRKWEEDYGEKFQANLLSEHGREVRDDKSKAAIKDKTQLMHLESNMHIQAVNQRRESMENFHQRRNSIPPRIFRTPSPEIEKKTDEPAAEVLSRRSSSTSSISSCDTSSIPVPAVIPVEVVSDVASAISATPAPTPRSAVSLAAPTTASKISGKTNPFEKLVSRRANLAAPKTSKTPAAEATLATLVEQENVCPSPS